MQVLVESTVATSRTAMDSVITPGGFIYGWCNEVREELVKLLLVDQWRRHLELKVDFYRKSRST